MTHWKTWSWVLLATAAHFVLAWLIVSAKLFEHMVVPVWPTTGLSLAMVALGGPRFALASMFGVATATLVVGAEPEFAALVGVNNLLESLVGGTILARRLDRRRPFHTLREVLNLPIAALAGAGVCATVGTLAFAMFGQSLGHDAIGNFFTWWLGNAMGGLVVAPLAAGLTTVRSDDWRRARTVESSALILLSVSLALIVFGPWPGQFINAESFPFLLFPAMIWLALRSSPLAMAAMNVVVSGIGFIETAQGYGPFATADQTVGMARLQVFLFVLCGTGLILTALNRQWIVAQRLAEDRRVHIEAILNHLPSVAWSSDETGQSRFISDNLAGVIGYSTREIAMAWPDIWFGRIHPDDLPKVRESHTRLFDSGAFDIEYRYQAKDGRWLWLHDQGNTMPEVIDGRRLAVGVFTDVTARKQAELDLHEKSTILQCQFELSRDGILVVAPDRRRLSINSRLAEIFHMPPDLLDNWSSERALAHAAGQVEDPPGYLEPIHRLYPDPVGTWDDIVRFKDGRIIARHSAPIRDAEEHYFGRVWCYRDVTAERHAEEVLRQTNETLERRVAERTADLKASQQLFESLAEVSPVGIFRTDASGNCQYVNRRWCEVAALSVELALGEGWSRALHPEDRQRVFDGWRRAAAAGGDFQDEYRFLDPLERETWVLGQARPLRDDAGNLLGYVGTITDITSGKETDARIQQQQTELAHVGRLNTIGEMSAALVHELSQPLTAISNYAAGCLVRVENGSGDMERLTAAVREIQRESNRAADIIRLVRNFVRKRPPVRPQTDVNTTIQDALAIASYEARRRGIAIHVDLLADAPPALVSAVELQQVLLNLLRNAKEALSNAHTPHPQVHIVSRRDERGRLEISVRDNGPGLNAEDAQRAFEPFRTTKPEGLGLGLAICRSIVESLGGQLWLADNSPQGAEFRFTLPIENGRHG